LSKTHDIVSKSKTELWHRILTHYLPLYFPEADRFHRSSRGDWFFAFVERYPSPHLISAMDRDAFIADAWEVVGRKVAKERLITDIYETAKTSVGLPIAADSDAVDMFRLVLGEGRGLISQRNQIERRAEHCGWPGKSPLFKRRTASVTSSSDTSQRTVTIPICAARRIPQSPQPSRDHAAHNPAGQWMARTVHGIIKNGEPYRPFFEG